jgi:ribonuclease H / adenosylcobalamin/alpha-ribazole phosphatase
MSRSFIIYADGGSRGNPGPAAYGAVLMEGAHVLAEFSQPIGIASNNVAEYSGLLAGLRAANDLDKSALIEVRMDSKLVVEQMSGNWQIKHVDMRRLALEARELHDPKLVKYKWIPREDNSHADRLVNLALDGDLRSAAPKQINFLNERLVSDEEPTKIFFVRHGETRLTPERRFSGSDGSNPGLTEKGFKQARKMAKEIASRKPDVLIASPMKRTQETASEISNLTGLKIVSDKKWLESGFGEWDELTVAEIMKLYPQEWQGWVSDTAYVPGKSGESFEAVAARTEQALSEIEADYVGKTIVVVTHHMVIKTLVANVLGAPLASMFHIDIAPCGITTVHSWPSDGLRALKSLSETSFAD